MRLAFGYFKKLIVAACLVCMTTGALAPMTAPNGSGGEQTASVSVDRTNKGDRLPYASRSKTHVNSPFLATTPQVLPKRPPLGCDPAFSSVADPTQARIYRRCLA